MQYSLYANRFDSDDAIYRLSKAAGMVGIALIGVAMAEALDDRSGLYVGGFLLARAMLLLLYERARRHVDDDAAAAARHYQLGYGVGGLAWLATLALHPSDRPVAWAAIVAVELLVPVVAWSRLEGSAVNVSHLSERLGVFAILVLGTGWLSVVEGVSATGLLPAVLVVAVGLLLGALCIWWLYFDEPRPEHWRKASLAWSGSIPTWCSSSAWPWPAAAHWSWSRGRRRTLWVTGRGGLSSGGQLPSSPPSPSSAWPGQPVDGVRPSPCASSSWRP